MKSVLSLLLICVYMLSAVASFVGCNSFAGGLAAFYDDGNFYNKVGNVVCSVFMGNNSYVPLFDDDTLKLDASVELSDYTVDDKLMGNGNAKLGLSALLNSKLNYDCTVDVEAFDLIDYSKRMVQQDNKMLIDYGYILNDIPLVYKDNSFNCFTLAYDTIKESAKKANYINGEESYKLNGVDFDTDTVEFALNSDVLSAWVQNLSNMLYTYDSTQYGDFSDKSNLVYGEWHYDVNEIWYKIAGDNLHLLWKRFFDDGVLCREIFKLYDTDNHNITVDIAYSEDDGEEFVQVTAVGYDGSYEFDIFAFTAEKTTENGSFETKANILIGDEILITAENKGDELEAEGKAVINMILVKELGPQNFNMDYSFSAEREGKSDNNNGLGMKQALRLSTKNMYIPQNKNYISFNAVVNLYAETTAKEPTVENVIQYYDVGILENMQYFNYGEEAITTANEALKVYLSGKKPDYVPPSAYVNEYSIDIIYDDGESLFTEGKYGKEYVELLMSDNYTYSYTFHSNEVGYPENAAYIYRKGDSKMYSYEYADGVKFKQYHDDTTVNEAYYDIEKIIYSEYTRDDYEKTYGDTEYIFYQSGRCVYESRKLIYEKYFDYNNNRYTFIFDENNKLEILAIESSADGSMMYTFITEMHEGVPENAFDMPDFERVNVLDYFE